MNALREQQRRLQQAVVAAALPTLDDLLAPGSRPGVYHHAYRARLAEALADNYAVLKRALGDATFEALALAYIDAHPSSTPSIRWYGDQLADFMAAREDLVPHPAMVDLARMDLATRDAFDEADAPAASLSDIAALPPQQFAALRFTAHPTLRLAELSWTVEPAWRALSTYDPQGGEGEPQLPAPVAHAHTLLAWRRELTTQWRSLDDMEARLLQAMLAGASFGELCDLAAQRLEGDAEGAATVAATVLRQWLVDGIFLRH